MNVSRRLEWALFGLLTGAALFVRCFMLSADPPVDLSYSTDVLTDPAQYTSFARNLVLWGTFNPLHDFRLVLFLKSLTTAVSYAVFALIGTGYVQSNIVALLFSFPAIIFLYFTIRKISDNLAALFFLAFMAFDYNQIFYGRYPFLENSLAFTASLALFIMVCTRKLIFSFAAGVVMAAGIFFGKMVGILFIFPVLCFGLFEYFTEYRSQLKKFLVRHGCFWAGFLGVLIFWYLFSYRPMANSVGGYLQDQALGLYGAPDGLKSVEFFLYKYATFGATSKLFERMPVAAFLAWFTLALFFFRAVSKSGWREELPRWAPGLIFLVAWVIAAYGSLMIWNYRPLRYQTIIIYPVYALAGLALSKLWFAIGRIGGNRLSPLFAPILYFLLLPPVFQLMAFSFASSVGMETYYEYATAMFIVSAIVAGAFFAAGQLFKKGVAFPGRPVATGLVIVFMGMGILPNMVHYIRWTGEASFTTEAAARDLPTIVSPEAVLSGPYAARLTQDNNLLNLIHMFGVANIDTAFFARYPITHLLVDKPNLEGAIEQYPNIMKRAFLVGEYRITSRPIFLYRIAGLTGNIQADNYMFSDYERARYYLSLGMMDSTDYYMQKYLEQNPDNLSGNLAFGAAQFERENMNEAGKYYNRAVNFSPTDFHLRYKLGEFYIKLYEITGDTTHLANGRREFERALLYNNTSVMLKNMISKILVTKDTVQFE